jgi:hypothetical protein
VARARFGISVAGEPLQRELRLECGEFDLRQCKEATDGVWQPRREGYRWLPCWRRRENDPNIQVGPPYTPAVI